MNAAAVAGFGSMLLFCGRQHGQPTVRNTQLHLPIEPDRTGKSDIGHGTYPRKQRRYSLETPYRNVAPRNSPQNLQALPRLASPPNDRARIPENKDHCRLEERKTGLLKPVIFLLHAAHDQCSTQVFGTDNLIHDVPETPPGI